MEAGIEQEIYPISGKRQALIEHLSNAPTSFLVKITIPLCMANACDAVETMATAYMLPQLREEFPDDARIITSCVFIGMLFGALFGASLLVICGPKRLLVISLVAEAVAAFVGSLSREGIGFAVWRLVAGCAIGAGIPALWATAEALMQPEYRRHKLLNLVSLCWSLGTVLTAFIAWLFFEHFEQLGLRWRQFYGFIGIVPLVTAVLVQSLVPESPDFLQLHGRDTELNEVASQIGAPPDALASGNVLHDTIDRDSTLSQQLAELTQEPWIGSLLKLAVAGFGTSFAWYGIGTWLLVIFKDVGVRDRYVAGIWFATSGMPGAILRHCLVGRVSARDLFAATLAVSACMCLALGKLVSTDPTCAGNLCHLHPQTAAVIICIFNTICTSVFNVQVSIWATPFPAKLQPLAIDLQSVAMRVGSILAQLATASMLEENKVVWLAVGNAVVLFVASAAAVKVDVRS